MARTSVLASATELLSSSHLLVLQARNVCTLSEAAYRMYQPEMFRQRCNGLPLSPRALIAHQSGETTKLDP